MVKRATEGSDMHPCVYVELGLRSCLRADEDRRRVEYVLREERAVAMAPAS
jgi:hypothetical protein